MADQKEVEKTERWWERAKILAMIADAAVRALALILDAPLLRR